MSDGCPILPTGITPAQYCFTASSCSAGTNLSNTGVSVVPGDITFTLIFLSKRSLENPFAKWITAALVAGNAKSNATVATRNNGHFVF